MGFTNCVCHLVMEHGLSFVSKPYTTANALSSHIRSKISTIPRITSNHAAPPPRRGKRSKKGKKNSRSKSPRPQVPAPDKVAATESKKENLQPVEVPDKMSFNFSDLRSSDGGDITPIKQRCVKLHHRGLVRVGRVNLANSKPQASLAEPRRRRMSPPSPSIGSHSLLSLLFQPF